MKYWATISADEGVYGFEIEADGFPQAMVTAAHLLRRKEQNRIKSIRIEIKGENHGESN